MSNRTLLESDKDVSAPEFAFTELARRIITGEMTPGRRLTEEQLSKELGVSRTPLRTAIDRLEASGMVMRQRNRSIYVAPMAVEEICELSELRGRIEGFVASRAAERAKAGEISLQRLKLIGQAADGELLDALSVNRMGREFHFELIKLSGLSHVTGLLENIYLNLERYRYALSEESGRLQDRSHEHQLIVRAVIDGDPDRAECVMRDHIKAGLDFYIRHMGLKDG